MSETPPKIQALHPPGDWLALRARAAEQLIWAADPVRAIGDLFELIAPELRLNVLLFCDVARNGQLQLVAHCGITKEQAASVADHFGRIAEAAPLVGHVANVRTSDDPRMEALKSIDLATYAAMPLDGGDRPASILGFGRCWTDRFDDDELAFLEAVSGYFAAALGRFRSEVERRGSEERLRLAMEVAGFGTFDYDMATGERIWSPELKAIYGFAPGAEITLGDLVRSAHPEDRQRASASIAESKQKSASGEFSEYRHEHRIIRADGELRWISVRGRTIFREVDGESRPARFIGVIQDITDRKLTEERTHASEERLQLAQELGGVASWDWVPGHDAWLSESYRDIFGLPPGARINQAMWLSFLHPEDRERSLACIRRALQGSAFDLEFRIIRPVDKEVRWIHSLGGVVRNGSDNVVRLVGISLDVTERKRDQERERLLTREVDHRAKNLLNIVQSMVQLTRADSLPAFVEEVIGRIHALARVHGLIAASRWEGASLSTLIEEELAPFSAGVDRLRQSGPVVGLKPAAAQSMALIIHELTINAVKYGALSSPGGRIEIIWSLNGPTESELILRWHESGGPAVAPPQKVGFGTNLIHGSIERHLGGTVHLDWRDEGLRCEIALPSRQLVSTAREPE